MPFSEGASPEEDYSIWIVAQSQIEPTSGQGASVGGHSPRRKSQANVNKAVAQVGAVVQPYSPALAILLGTDDF